MRIGLDARTIYWHTRRGTGKNLIDLYRHLAAARPHWRITAYHRQQGGIEPLLPRRTVKPKQIEIRGDRIDAWLRWRLPLAAWQDGLDILHCPANLCPTWMPIDTVVTIHDLIPLDMPQGHSTAYLRRFEQSVRNACRRAAWIICPSRYTRGRLIDEFGADAQRITVNPWAPDSSIQPVTSEHWQPVLSRYGVRKPFVLHFGSAAPRKNTRRVIEAWSMLDKPVRQAHELLIVGLDRSAKELLSQTVARLGVSNSVLLHTFADEADLPTLLSAATTLAYPSLSEGFGLPILDAWAAGSTVLTSNCTSLPEVAGDAAVMADPTDSCSIARGLRRLLTDRTFRAELRARAEKRLAHYDWPSTANRFAQAIEQAAGQQPSSLRDAA